MINQLVLFDRYNWDLRNMPDLQTVLDPSDYNTDEEEVEWYVNQIIVAQSKYHFFCDKIEKRVAFAPIVLWMVGIIVWGVLMGWEILPISYKLYGFMLLIGSWLCILWALAVYKFSFVANILRVFYREKFFPPIMPNVERFLSYCFMAKVGIMKPEDD